MARSNPGMFSGRHFTPWVVITWMSLIPVPGRGQTEELRLQGLLPTGLRTTLTDSWATMQFSVVNPTPEDRAARVVVLFPDQPAVRYGRDVWVPARSALSAQLPVGPPPPPSRESVEVRSVLYDRTGGGNRLLLPPGEGERLRSRLVRYRARTPSTTLLIDSPPPPGPVAGKPPAAPGPPPDALVRAARAAAGLSPEIATFTGPVLPPQPEAFDGTDHVVLAGNWLRADPAGTRALRQWVERGGRLWVMLDLTDLDTVAPLLGDDAPLQGVDRVGLTTVRLQRAGARAAAPGREFERPVELVRVLTADGDRVATVVDGWPAAFARTIGRGRVLFTALGAAGWLPSSGTAADPPAAPPEGKGGPPGRRADPWRERQYVEELAAELHPRGQVQPLSPDALQPLLADEVGYAVPGRGTAAAVLGTFVLTLVALGVALRRARRPEWFGWLAAAAALGAAAVFAGLAATSRRAVPPTEAVAAIAEAVPGTGEVTVIGLFAVYRPESGPVRLAAPHGGLLDLDLKGLEDQGRLRVQTDTSAWHLEQMSLPAGVQTGQFRYTAETGPVTAVARFGPDGVVARVAAPGFGPLSDALIATPARQPIALRELAASEFTAGPADTLAPGQFLAGTVLTDRQQRRQAVYRQFLGGSLPPHLDGRDLLLAWAEPGVVPFTAADGIRTAGSTLLVVPVTFEQPPAGTRVTIPPAFVAVRRADGVGGRPTLESAYPAEMRLRFQLPATVLPLDPERAALHLWVRAPSRRVAISGLAAGRSVPLFAADSPADPIRVELADPELLRLDPEGGLHVVVAITNLGAPEREWRIESIGLEVVGRTGGGQ